VFVFAPVIVTDMGATLLVRRLSSLTKGVVPRPLTALVHRRRISSTSADERFRSRFDFPMGVLAEFTSDNA
jgi:hypothetical protein